MHWAFRITLIYLILLLPTTIMVFFGVEPPEAISLIFTAPYLFLTGLFMPMLLSLHLTTGSVHVVVTSLGWALILGLSSVVVFIVSWILIHFFFRE